MSDTRLLKPNQLVWFQNANHTFARYFELNPTKKRRELGRLRTEETRLNAVIQQGIPSLSNEDAFRLMERFEPATVAG